MLNPDGTKTCPICSLALDTSQFYKINRKSGDGFAGYCKSCTKTKAKAWQDANPEKMLLKWRADSAKQSARRASGEMTKTEKEAHNTLKREWYATHKEYVSERTRAYKKRLKDKDLSLYRAKTAIYNNRTRCRRLGIRSDFKIEDWKLVIEAFGRRCAFCGSAPKFLDLDHIIPIHKGGEDVVGNIVPICRPCNSHKGCSEPLEFAELMDKNIAELQRLANVRAPSGA